MTEFLTTNGPWLASAGLGRTDVGDPPRPSRHGGQGGRGGPGRCGGHGHVAEHQPTTTRGPAEPTAGDSATSGFTEDSGKHGSQGRGDGDGLVQQPAAIRSDLDRFVCAHLDPIHAAARLLTDDRDGAEDLVVATFGTAVAAGRWPALEQVRPWLYRLLLGTSSATTEPQQEDATMAGTDEMGCHTDRQPADSDALVRLALRTLSLESRFAVYLADVDRLSYRQIGEILGEHPDVVRARLHEARRTLTARLAHRPHRAARDVGPGPAKEPGP